MRDAQKNPFSGLGKPEPLKYELQGCWSRRITEEHRLVYKIEGDMLIILSCRYHYD
nr:Txe/YoeB family addiction module toxin [Cyanothece sp. BG0011]